MGLVYPGLKSDSSLNSVVSTRSKKFDGALVEADPPAIVTKHGILLVYNGKNGTGANAAGTTFAEGLVLFHNKWFLYYGAADSYIGVAVQDNSTAVPVLINPLEEAWVDANSASRVIVASYGPKIQIKGAQNRPVSVYTTNRFLIFQSASPRSEINIPVVSGLYIVRTGPKAVCVVVR